MREALGERWPCLDHSFAAPPGTQRLLLERSVASQWSPGNNIGLGKGVGKGRKVSEARLQLLKL